MEEARHTLIVKRVAPWALLVAERNGATPDGMPVIAAQSCKIERVNQVADRHVSFFSKPTSTFSDDFSPLRKTAPSLLLRRYYARASQQAADVSGNGGRHTLTCPEP